MKDFLTEEMRTEFEKSIKIGVVATIGEDQLPHMTVLSTLMGKGNDQMMFGKFVEGLSKENILNHPQSGFLIMNPEKAFWTGKMTYDHFLKEGEDLVLYNNQPLYRYNTYFGINTVYYFRLKEISDQQTLPMGKIILNSLKILMKKHRFVEKNIPPIMKPWAVKFTGKLDTLMFLSYLGDDGYPIIIPCIQAQSAGSSRILLRDDPYRDQLSKLKQGMKIAMLAFSMSMETVLLKGSFSGFDKRGYGFMQIEIVYNSMPPVHGFVYPETPIEAIDF